MPNATQSATRKESQMEFLVRNLRTAISFLPDSDSRHMTALRFSGLPVIIDGVYGWERFLSFVFSWQPMIDDAHNPSNKCQNWSAGLNPDHREEEKVLKEMEKALFLCHYLSALITNSRISIAWAKLDEGNPRKGEWLSESSELMDALSSLNTPDQWKTVQQINKKMRDLLRAIH